MIFLLLLFVAMFAVMCISVLFAIVLAIMFIKLDQKLSIKYEKKD